MAQFNIQAAKSAGYSDKEIQDFMTQNKYTAYTPSTQSTQTTPVSQTASVQSATGNSILDGLLGIGKQVVQTGIINPLKYVGEAGAQAARFGIDPKYRDAIMSKTMTPDQAKYVSSQPETYLLNHEDVATPTDIAKTGTKAAAGAASLLPFGAGAGWLGTLLGGAGQGALYGLGSSQNGNELRDTGVGALGGAVGAGLFKGGGDILGKVFGKVAPELSDAASSEAANSIKYKSASPGVKLYSSQFNVPTKLAESLKPEDTFSAMLKHNITGSVDEIGNKANHVTNLVSKIQRAVLSSDPKEINIGDALSTFKSDLAKVPQLSSGEANGISSFTRGLLPKGSLPDLAHPLEVFDTIKQLETLGYEYLSTDTGITGNIKNKYIGKAYLNVASNLKDAIEKQVESNNSVKSIVTPDIVQKASEISPLLAKQLSKAETFGDLRATQAPFVKMQKIVDLTKQSASNHGADLNETARGLGNFVPSLSDPLAFLKPLLSGQSINTNAANAVEKAGNIGAGGVVNPIRSALNNPIISKVLSQGAINQGVNAVAGQNVPTAMASTQDANAQIAQPPTPQTSDQTAQNNIGGIPKITPQMLVAARATMNDAHYNQLLQLYTLQRTGGLDTKAHDALLKLNNASSLLDQFETGINKVGLQSNPLLARTLGAGNKLATEAGAISNPNLTTFQSLKAGTRAVLARTFGEVGNLSETEQEAVLKLIPDVTDSKAESDAKITQLRNLISTLKQNTTASTVDLGTPLQ